MDKVGGCKYIKVQVCLVEKCQFFWSFQSRVDFSLIKFNMESFDQQEFIGVSRFTQVKNFIVIKD